MARLHSAARLTAAEWFPDAALCEHEGFTWTPVFVQEYSVVPRSHPDFTRAGRTATREQINASLGKCSVFSIASRGSFACLFLSADASSRLGELIGPIWARGGRRPANPGGRRGPDATRCHGSVSTLTLWPYNSPLTGAAAGRARV
jgi:hypothetical protein